MMVAVLTPRLLANIRVALTKTFATTCRVSLALVAPVMVFVLSVPIFIIFIFAMVVLVLVVAL